MKEKKIKELLDSIRPFLINDGGDIEFEKIENNIVYVRLLGACSNCSLIDATLHDSIEQIIKEEFPEIREVINISE